jgi:transposase-like protein
MLTCPHCHDKIVVRNLRHQGMFKSYRVCPNCGGHFTVDTKTKQRQAAFIIIALVALAFTLLLYLQGTSWLLPALIVYVVLGALIYWGNKQVYFVPAQKRTTEDT